MSELELFRLVFSKKTDICEFKMKWKPEFFFCNFYFLFLLSSPPPAPLEKKMYPDSKSYLLLTQRLCLPDGQHNKSQTHPAMNFSNSSWGPFRQIWLTETQGYRPLGLHCCILGPWLIGFWLRGSVVWFRNSFFTAHIDVTSFQSITSKFSGFLV